MHLGEDGPLFLLFFSLSLRPKLYGTTAQADSPGNFVPVLLVLSCCLSLPIPCPAHFPWFPPPPSCRSQADERSLSSCWGYGGGRVYGGIREGVNLFPCTFPSALCRCPPMLSPSTCATGLQVSCRGLSITCEHLGSSGSCVCYSECA